MMDSAGGSGFVLPGTTTGTGTTVPDAPEPLLAVLHQALMNVVRCDGMLATMRGQATPDEQNKSPEPSEPGVLALGAMLRAHTQDLALEIELLAADIGRL